LISTLATFNISSYIIGIGDRHLENILLDLKSGGIIGIDFGHAFGTATQFLPIPELMPFRLTRQLSGFLQPLDTEGLLKYNMIHVLRALQEHKDVLLNTMDVFINEPLLDWEKLARKVVREQGGDDAIGSWASKKKIEMAKRKLEGYNPAFITITELNESVHSKTAYLNALHQIVSGTKDHNIRARVGDKCTRHKSK